MRTTVTLDEDVERMLREAMHRSRSGFKQTLNTAIRAGLSVRAPSDRSPFVVKPRPLGLRAGFDPAGFNKYWQRWFAFCMSFLKAPSPH